MRPEDLKLQLGSLNDEIKQTVAQINHLHQERDKFLVEIDEARSTLSQTRQAVLKAREDLSALLLTIKNDSEDFVKSSNLKEAALNLKITDLQEKVSNISEQADSYEKKRVKALADKIKAEDEEKLADGQAHKSKQEAGKLQLKLDSLRFELKELLSKCTQASSEYERLTLSQSSILKQITTGETLLRVLNEKTAKAREITANFESQIYSLEDTISGKEREHREITNQLKAIELSFNLTKKKLEQTEDKITLEKTEHAKWLQETKTKADENFRKTVQRIDDLEQRKKDLKVVEDRLRKLWKQNSNLPFPKLNA